MNTRPKELHDYAQLSAVPSFIEWLKENMRIYHDARIMLIFLHRVPVITLEIGTVSPFEDPFGSGKAGILFTYGNSKYHATGTASIYIPVEIALEMRKEYLSKHHAISRLT